MIKVLEKSLYFIIIVFISIISVFSFIGIYNTALFDLMHMLFWYLFSTLIVVFVWFFTVKIFKIREIPVYDDVKYLLRNIKTKKSSKKEKKK